MNKRLIAGLATLLFLFGMGGSVSAATITYNINNQPTGFENLGVDFGDGGGTVYYDVTVTWGGAFASIFGYGDYASDPRLVAWGDSGMAATAINSLHNALTADGFFPMDPSHPGDLMVAYSLSGTIINGRNLNIDNGLGSTGSWTGARSAAYIDSGYTQWAEASVVPIPGALWLLGSGIASIAGIGWRRKVKAKQQG